MLRAVKYFLLAASLMCTINLGSGLLETVYQKIYIYELEENGLNVKPELAIPVSYDGKESDLNFRVDILVEDEKLGLPIN